MQRFPTLISSTQFFLNSVFWRHFNPWNPVFLKRSTFQVKHHFSVCVHEITEAMGDFEVTDDQMSQHVTKWTLDYFFFIIDLLVADRSV